MAIISKEFYSNCFIEAVKAKIKDPKNVKITFIKPKYNKVKWIPHFLWSDGKSDFDFGTSETLKPYQIFLFKGNIRERSLGWNERYKEKLMKKYEKGD